MIPNKKLILPFAKEAIDNYVKFGYDGGSFIDAVLKNDLTNAVGNASHDVLDNLPHIVAYLYNDCPADCWGSKEKVTAWYNKF